MAAWKVTVTVARTARAQTTPVEASTPEGTSTLTMGAPQALAASIASAIAPRGSPVKPVPSSASMTAAGLRRGVARPIDRGRRLRSGTAQARGGAGARRVAGAREVHLHRRSAGQAQEVLARVSPKLLAEARR